MRKYGFNIASYFYLAFLFLSLFCFTTLAETIDPRKDYYKILDVSENATEEEIKRSYKRLMQRWHPDLQGPFGGNEAEATKKSAEIGEAYDVLKDPYKRARYEQMKADPEATVETTPYKTWFDRETQNSLDREFQEKNLSVNEILFSSYEGKVRIDLLNSADFDDIEDKKIRKLYERNLSVDRQSLGIKENQTSITLEGRFWAFKGNQHIPNIFETNKGEFLVVSNNDVVFRLYGFELSNRESFLRSIRNRLSKKDVQEELQIINPRVHKNTNPLISRIGQLVYAVGPNGQTPEQSSENKSTEQKTNEKTERTANNNRQSENVKLPVRSIKGELAFKTKMRYSPERINQLTVEEVHELFTKHSEFREGLFRSMWNSQVTTARNFGPTTFAFYVASGAMMYFVGTAGPDPQRAISEMLTSPIGLFSFYAFVAAAGLIDPLLTSLNNFLSSHTLDKHLQNKRNQIHKTGQVPRYSIMGIGLKSLLTV